MLLDVGNWGYQVGAVGIVIFTISFLVIVRWWTDLLGRTIAGVLFTMSAVLFMSTARMLDPHPGQTFFVWRAIVFWAFGLGVWIALGSFIWAQFLAPRVRTDRLTTRKEHRNESQVGSSSDRRDPDGGPHDRAGRVH